MKEDAAQITSKVTKKEADFNTVYQRMDDDFDIWALKSGAGASSYVSETADKIISGMHDNDVDVVSNDLRTFSDQVQSTLSDAEMQIIIRMAQKDGEDKRDDVAALERLLYFALDMADRRLRKLLMPTLRDAAIWYSLIRGGNGAEVLVYETKNGVIFAVQPLDPRWLTYDVGGDGLMWSSYKTFRSGEALKDEWGFTSAKEKDNEVINYWRHDGDKNFVNAVVCNNEFVKEPKKYTMRSFPVIIVPVATRPQIAMVNDIEDGGYGDSIFAPSREINKTRNRFASIAATHANLLAKQPLINYYDEKGKQLESTVYMAEAVLNLPKGHNELGPAPMKELAPTVVQLLNWLNQQMEKATLPNIPVGTPAPSGTLYNLVQEAGNKVFNPQLKNLNYLYAEICRLIEEQLIDGNIKVNVKQVEKKRYFETQVTPVDLKKPHLTIVEFTARTPWTQFDTYQIADMAKRLGIPDAFIHEYILKLPDPKGISDLSAIEMAEHSPKMAMVRAIQALMVAGRNDEAEGVMRDLYAFEMAEQQASVEPTQSPSPMGGGI